MFSSGHERSRNAEVELLRNPNCALTPAEFQRVELRQTAAGYAYGVHPLVLRTSPPAAPGQASASALKWCHGERLSYIRSVLRSPLACSQLDARGPLAGTAEYSIFTPYEVLRTNTHYREYSVLQSC